jgi:hypothetical protein
MRLLALTAPAIAFSALVPLLVGFAPRQQAVIMTVEAEDDIFSAEALHQKTGS